MTYDKTEIATDLDRYHKGMRSMNGFGMCLAIERKYRLDGYPPQIVSVALVAGSKGADMYAAVDHFIGADEGESDE
jgi:hypothetical protein